MNPGSASVAAADAAPTPHTMSSTLEAWLAAQSEAAHEPDSGLPERDTRILDFERQWWRHAGAKEEAIRSEFALSPARYYQLLNAVIDSPEAVRHDPMLVRRLQRARDARTQARVQRSFTISDRGGDKPTEPRLTD